MAKQAGEIIVKIIMSIAAVCGIAFAGLVIYGFTAMMGIDRFYSTLTLMGTGAAAIFVILFMFITSRLHRILKRSLLGVIIIAALASAGHEVWKAYYNSIPVVSDQEVDMDHYMPFQEDSKLAELSEPSGLKLTSELPRLDGATALYPLYAAFAQAVYPEREYSYKDSEVMVNTTPEAYKNLIEGKVDLIFAAAPSEPQKAAARRDGLELKLTPIGREAFVFFVNADNPVQGLTTEQLLGIYSGEITNWSEVGGENKAIRAFQRPEGSGSQTMLQKIMEGRELAEAPSEDVVSGMGGIIQRTADYRNHKNALGFSFLFYATEMVRNGDIRLLEMDGVTPNRETIANGDYPLASEFYAVTAGSGNPNVDKLIEWILSPQGQELIEKTGYTPLQSGR